MSPVLYLVKAVGSLEKVHDDITKNFVRNFSYKTL